MVDSTRTMRVDVVSAEESIFSGEARFVALPGETGELGIYPRHTPLITRIRPGSVRIETADGGEEFVFVAGGVLEVQPDGVTVLSDTAIRGKDLDEEKAKEARQAAEAELAGSGRLVIRPSGTEPVIRVMAEGDDPAVVEQVVDRICEAVRKAA